MASTASSSGTRTSLPGSDSRRLHPMAVSSRVRGRQDGVGGESVWATDPGGRRWMALRAPWSGAILLVPVLVGASRLLLGLHRPFDPFGDQAIFETAVRRVASGTQLLGPYSRFGFHQLGPAYFFVQAPFSWATGGASRAMSLGALAINAGAAIGSVLVVRRVLGEPAARWAAAVAAGYMVLLKPELLADPWPAFCLALPLLLTMVLAAARASGSWPAAGGALVAGTYVGQTHVSAAAALVAVFAAPASARGMCRPARPPHRPSAAEDRRGGRRRPPPPPA